MKKCNHCGEEVANNAKFCKNCGEQISKETKTQSIPTIQNRNIATYVILSIVTCGIYGLYWLITMNDETNSLSSDDGVSGGMLILLIIVTCGIYSIYWNYQMGRKLYEAGKTYGIQTSDNSILYLVLALFGFSIVNYCLIQSDLNRFAN